MHSKYHNTSTQHNNVLRHCLSHRAEQCQKPPETQPEQCHKTRDPHGTKGCRGAKPAQKCEIKPNTARRATAGIHKALCPQSMPCLQANGRSKYDIRIITWE